MLTLTVRGNWFDLVTIYRRYGNDRDAVDIPKNSRSDIAIKMCHGHLEGERTSQKKIGFKSVLLRNSMRQG